MNNACRATIIAGADERVLQPDSENGSNTHPARRMTLGNMREQGVHHLIAFCHNDAWRHQALIDASRCHRSDLA
jgi:hypothetical protein